jgi:hypothetical protein
MILMGSWFCLLGQQAGGTAVSKAVPRPILPYYDWNACPGEGCTYGKWTARKTITVFNTYKQARRRITQLRPGDRVLAITGVVITFKPGVIRMDRDLPDQGLKRGDTILTYAYRGEGTSAVWFKDQYISDFDIGFTKWPDGTGCGRDCRATYLDTGVKAWWVKLKLASGKLGWIDMANSEFDDSNLLSALHWHICTKPETVCLKVAV